MEEQRREVSVEIVGGALVMLVRETGVRLEIPADRIEESLRLVERWPRLVEAALEYLREDVERRLSGSGRMTNHSVPDEDAPPLFSDDDRELLRCALWVAQRYTSVNQVLAVVERIYNAGDLPRPDRWAVYVQEADRARLGELHGGETLVHIIPDDMPPPEPTPAAEDASPAEAEEGDRVAEPEEQSAPEPGWLAAAHKQLAPETLAMPATPATPATPAETVIVDPTAVTSPPPSGSKRPRRTTRKSPSS